MSRNERATPLRDAATAGNAVAFAVAYDRYAPALYALLLRNVRDAQRAQEILQDAFVAAWSNAKNFDPATSSELTWLVTMARSRVGAGSFVDTAVDPVPPPPNVRAAMLRRIDRFDRLTTLEKPAPPTTPRWWFLASAAIVLVLAALSLIQVQRSREELRHLDDEIVRLREERQKLSQTLAAMSGASTISLAAGPRVPQASGRVFLDSARGRAVAFFHGLPPSGEDRTYQLWIFPAEGAAAQSAGIFAVDPSGNGSLILQSLPSATSRLIVTLEPGDGAEAPSGEKVLDSRP